MINSFTAYTEKILLFITSFSYSNKMVLSLLKCKLFTNDQKLQKSENKFRIFRNFQHLVKISCTTLALPLLTKYHLI